MCVSFLLDAFACKLLLLKLRVALYSTIQACGCCPGPQASHPGESLRNFVMCTVVTHGAALQDAPVPSACCILFMHWEAIRACPSALCCNLMSEEQFD